MKTLLRSAFGMTVLILIWLGGSPAAGRNPIPGQVVIKLKPGARPELVLRGKPAHLNDSIPELRTYLVKLDVHAFLDTFIRQLHRNPVVQFAEPNYWVELPESFQISQSFPDDNCPPLLEGEEPSSFYDQPATYSIGADSAQLRATGQGVTVAVIDNGFDFSHPLLAPRLLPTGYDFLNGDSVPAFDSGTVSSHGSFVAGLIVRTAPDCDILPLQAFNSNGIGSSYAVANAIYYAIQHGAEVINMSFGTSDSSIVIGQACVDAAAAGISLVAAAGNSALSTPVYPAAFPGVIAVSGLDTLELLASFSNYGPHIDVCAPAVKLYSSLAGAYQWGTWSGTSFAAPLVSAACAMILQLDPAYSNSAMEMHIQQTAETQLPWGTVIPRDPGYGFGSLDIARAIWSVGGVPAVTYGDMNGSGNLDVVDAVYLSNYIQAGGPPPVPPARADLNCDGTVDMDDVDYILDFIYKGGPPPGDCP